MNYPETRYIKWDYDNNTAVEYERKGECNSCGACCRAVIRFHASWHDRDWRHDDEANPQRGCTAAGDTGVWNEVSRGNVRRFFGDVTIDVSEETMSTHKCPQLTEDNQCGVHLSKYLICKGWPFAPEHVTPFPECSYEFVEIQRWTIHEPIPKL